VGFWGWVSAVGAGWFTASVLVAIAWALLAPRKSPAEQQHEDAAQIAYLAAYRGDR
jgi:hypothetical protein